MDLLVEMTSCCRLWFPEAEAEVEFGVQDVRKGSKLRKMKQVGWRKQLNLRQAWRRPGCPGLELAGEHCLSELCLAGRKGSSLHTAASVSTGGLPRKTRQRSVLRYTNSLRLGSGSFLEGKSREHISASVKILSPKNTSSFPYGWMRGGPSQPFAAGLHSSLQTMETLHMSPVLSPPALRSPRGLHAPNGAVAGLRSPGQQTGCRDGIQKCCPSGITYWGAVTGSEGRWRHDHMCLKEVQFGYTMQDFWEWMRGWRRMT